MIENAALSGCGLPRRPDERPRLEFAAAGFLAVRPESSGARSRAIYARLFANLTGSRDYTETPSILGRYEHAVLLVF